MIAVDIGNTSIHIAGFEKGKIVKTCRLLTSGVTKPLLKKALGAKVKEPVLICSVVPKITRLFQNLGLSLCIVGRHIKVPIKSNYEKNKAGPDRLVGAFAAKKLFSGTRLVLDFGTAITLDFLSKQGVYQGGLILPGIGSTLNVFSGCAMLPEKVKFGKMKKAIPTTTEDSIAKGVKEGFSLMINSLTAKYKKKLKITKAEKVIITGGEARVIMPYLNFPFKYEPFLVLRGLELLSRKLSEITKK